MPFFGLSGRLFLSVLAGLALALAGLALVAVQALNSSTQNTLEERLALAQMTAGRYDDFVEQTIRVTQTMIDAMDLASGEATPEAQQRFVAALHDHLGDTASYVAIVDPDFRSRLVYPALSEVLQHDFSDSNCVNHAFDQGLPQVTRSFTLGTPTPAVAMNVPIVTRDGVVIGVVLVTLDLNAPEFVSLLETRDLGETGYIEVIDRTGIILGATRPELRWQEDDHAGFFETLILERRTSVGTCHNCHDAQIVGGKTEDLVAFAPLSIAPWGIAVRQSRNEAFLPTDALGHRLLLVGALTFAAVGAATVLLARHLVKPLRGLTKACSEIADGKLDVPLPERGPAEVGLLGDAFDMMRARLKSSLDEINTWNSELERLVSERSRELEASRQELMDANRDLSALNNLNLTLAQSMSVQRTVDTALDNVIELAGMERGWICLLDGQEVHGVASHHTSAGDPACLCTWPPAQRVIARCAEEGHALATTVPLAVPRDNAIELEARGCRSLLVCIPLSAKGHMLGLLSLISSDGQRLPEVDLALLTSIGTQVGIALQNALLYRTLRENKKTQQILLHKIITAQEEERRRIARELHDETSQALTAISVGLETAMRAPAASPEDVQTRLVPMKALATGALRELKCMIQDLRPSLLDDLGLIPAIDWYADTRLHGQDVQVVWEITGDEHRLPMQLETTIFRIAQEAISNVVQHARAENVRISLGYLNDRVVFEIEDDGQGFDPEAVISARQGSGAYGLMGMQERVTLMNGRLEIDSEPGEGTRVCVEIPCENPKIGGNGQDPRLTG